jgi:hypothetical protein
MCMTLAALMVAPRTVTAQSSWRPLLSSSLSFEKTEGVYYSMGTLSSLDVRLGFERRDGSTAPLFALSGSVGKGSFPLSGITCPLIQTCAAPPPPWVQTAMLWTGARIHRAGSAVTLRMLLGAGGIRVDGEGTDSRDGVNAARATQFGVRGEVDYAINDRFGVLFGAQYIDAGSLEAGMRRGGLSIGLRRH